MKFYDSAPAPSPRRVRIFLAEKAITLPTVQVDLRHGEQFTEAFRAVNPDCTVPVLELDDGTRVADAVGICVYFEGLGIRRRAIEAEIARLRAANSLCGLDRSH